MGEAAAAQLEHNLVGDVDANGENENFEYFTLTFDPLTLLWVIIPHPLK